MPETHPVTGVGAGAGAGFAAELRDDCSELENPT